MAYLIGAVTDDTCKRTNFQLSSCPTSFPLPERTDLALPGRTDFQEVDPTVWVFRCPSIVLNTTTVEIPEYPIYTRLLLASTQLEFRPREDPTLSQTVIGNSTFTYHARMLAVNTEDELAWCHTDTLGTFAWVNRVDIANELGNQIQLSGLGFSSNQPNGLLWSPTLNRLLLAHGWTGSTQPRIISLTKDVSPTISNPYINLFNQVFTQLNNAFSPFGCTGFAEKGNTLYVCNGNAGANVHKYFSNAASPSLNPSATQFSVSGLSIAKMLWIPKLSKWLMGIGDNNYMSQIVWCNDDFSGVEVVVLKPDVGDFIDFDYYEAEDLVYGLTNLGIYTLELTGASSLPLATGNWTSIFGSNTYTNIRLYP